MPPADDDDRPATRKDLRVLRAELRAEMHQLRAEMHQLRAEIMDKLDSRTTALMFSQIGAIIAVAAIAFAN